MIKRSSSGEKIALMFSSFAVFPCDVACGFVTSPSFFAFLAARAAAAAVTPTPATAAAIRPTLANFEGFAFEPSFGLEPDFAFAAGLDFAFAFGFDFAAGFDFDFAFTAGFFAGFALVFANSDLARER